MKIHAIYKYVAFIRIWNFFPQGFLTRLQTEGEYNTTKNSTFSILKTCLLTQSALILLPANFLIFQYTFEHFGEVQNDLAI